MCAVNHDVALRTPLRGEGRGLLQLVRRGRHAVPAAEQEVGSMHAGCAPLGKLAGEVHDARPPAAQLPAVAPSEPPARSDLIRRSDAEEPVVEVADPGVQPCREVEASKQNVGPCGHLPGDFVLAQNGHALLHAEEHGYDRVHHREVCQRRQEPGGRCIVGGSPGVLRGKMVEHPVARGAHGDVLQVDALYCTHCSCRKGTLSKSRGRLASRTSNAGSLLKEPGCLSNLNVP
mmetsp:Transcript_126412/g.393428  ORF Transcript_126412/g.393428 Transcript_126412/m.393428 type:complete len:232 (+) Transcript_126412:285-980(+)